MTHDSWHYWIYYWYTKTINIFNSKHNIFPQGCDNGRCAADGTCVCNEGYQLDAKTRKFCTPICPAGCPNGICKAPDTCECKIGFRFSTSLPAVCEPVCSTSCSSGHCIAPDSCGCKEGYAKEGNGCRPICKRYLGCTF